MKEVDLNQIEYYGADIILPLIEQNKQRYGKRNINFRKLDLIKDSLPTVDLILCRDCLVHFSYEDTFSSLRNICSSKSHYLLTTTFTDRRKNTDISTSEWRPINMILKPFNFPDPVMIINEGCTETNTVRC